MKTKRGGFESEQWQQEWSGRVRILSQGFTDGFIWPTGCDPEVLSQETMDSLTFLQAEGRKGLNEEEH